MQKLQDFVIDQLRELYNAETQLKIILEKMAYQTSNESLRHKFEKLSKDMDFQTAKLDKLFSLLGAEIGKDRYAYVMEGIGKELQSFIELDPGPEIRDAGFIAISQKAKHYQIAMFGTLREYANELGNREAETLLSELLEEEKQADREFSDKAMSGINQRAVDNSFDRQFASTNVSEH
jgi:ferritin-like metal-binding protein YciE